jgi:hypothetical protein
VPELLGLTGELALKDGVTVSLKDALSEAPAEPVRRSTVTVTRRLSDCDTDTELVTEGVSQFETPPVGDCVCEDVTVHESLLSPEGDADAEPVTDGEPVLEPPPSLAAPWAVSVAVVDGVELEEPASEKEAGTDALTDGDADAVAVFVAVGLANRMLVALTVMVISAVGDPGNCDEVTDRDPEGDTVGEAASVRDSVGEALVEAELVGERDAVEEGEPVGPWREPVKGAVAKEKAHDVELPEKVNVGEKDSESEYEPVSVPVALTVLRAVPDAELLVVPEEAPVELCCWA